MKYAYEWTSDIGNGKKKNEDNITFTQLDQNNLLAIIADGSHSIDGYVMPASFVAGQMSKYMKWAFEQDKESVLYNPHLFMESAVRYGDGFLCALKLANEEIFSGYNVSLTMAFFTEDDTVYYVHCGTTRLYVLRGQQLVQMTKDHTVAQELYDNGTFKTLEELHTSDERLITTSELGHPENPSLILEKKAFKMKENDFILMATKGIYYAIAEEYMVNIMFIQDGKEDDELHPCNNLVLAAKDQVGYPDNMSALMVGYGREIR